MDLLTIAGVTMLVGWAWITFTTTAPGWVHLFLTLGVFLVIWRIVVRGTPDPVAPKETPIIKSKR
jgi:hypothetical protein